MNSTSESAATSGAARGKRFWGALAVMALFSAVMVATSQPTGADATKTLTASCSSPDPETQALLASFGDLSAPITVKTTAPAFVEPEQTGVDIALTWSLSLPSNVVDIIAGITPSLTISNAQVNTIVDGPTSTELIPGSPPAQTINLVAGQAFNSEFPAFTGQLNDIGTGGIIKLRTDKISFLITLAAGPISEIELECATNATIASIPIKVAGSPDITQPIELTGTPGQPVSVDVLNQFVTNGFTKDGQEQQVDPSTLKIVEGDATIENGQIVAGSPAAGSSSDVTFEVCAGTVVLAEAEPGVSESQILRLYDDRAGFFGNLSYRRQLGARLTFGGEEAASVLWTASQFGVPWTPSPDKSDFNDPALTEAENDEAITRWWANNVNRFWTETAFRAPSAAEVQASLESIPTIGPGNVTVTKLPREDADRAGQPGTLKFHPYKVDFTGDLANKSVEGIGVSDVFSFIPQIDIAGLIPAGDGDGGGEPAEPEAPIPGSEGVAELEPGDPFYIPKYEDFRPIGGSAQKYLEYIDAAIQVALNNQQFERWGELVSLQLTVTFENLLDVVDVGAATALLAQIIIPAPDSVEEVKGEDPIPAQTQELCSQGIVTVASAADVDGTTTAPAGGPGSDVEGTQSANTNSNSGGAALSVTG
ncbi:MAG: hypothetical protein ACR2OH_12625 [Microthrixaceae bacterium]